MGMGAVRNDGSTRRGTEWDCGNQAQPSKAQTLILLAPSPEAHSPLGVLQEQICFGLLREGLQGTEGFQEGDKVCASSKH